MYHPIVPDSHLPVHQLVVTQVVIRFSLLCIRLEMYVGVVTLTAQRESVEQVQHSGGIFDKQEVTELQQNM